MKKLLTLALVFFMSGCATVNTTTPYVIHGDKAALEINVPKLKNPTGIANLWIPLTASISVFSNNGTCPWASSDESDKSYLYTTSLSSGSDSTRVEVPVGKEVYFAISDSNGNTRCDQSVKFFPEKNTSYLLDVTAHENAFIRCSAALYKLENGNRIPVGNAKYAKPENMFLGLFDFSEVCKSSK